MEWIILLVIILAVIIWHITREETEEIVNEEVEDDPIENEEKIDSESENEDKNKE